MKKIILTALVAGALVSAASAQSKLDGPAAQLADLVSTNAAALSRGGDFKAMPAAVEPGEAVAVLVTYTDDSALENIEKLGGEIVNTRADMALVRLDPLMFEEAALHPGVRSISLGYDNHLHLDAARALTHVDEIHAGKGLPQAYDGTGVICGIMDTGIDANHISFLDENGKNRISRMWVITGSNSAIRTLETEEQISAYSTDISDETHGTHVLGIMAGGYKGNVDRLATINPRTDKPYNKRDMPNPFYGVATGAELAPCCGTLAGNNILLAAEHILDYAKEKGKPAVMNLSLGHNYGPHDGSTTANRYLAEVGKEMLIVVSAGNEAGAPISLHKTFESADDQVQSFLFNNSVVSCNADIWSADESPVELTFLGYDAKGDSIAFEYTFSTELGTTYLTGTAYNVPTYIRDEKLDAYWGNRTGIICTRSINADNGRFNISLSVTTGQGTDKEALIIPAIRVKGVAGKSADIYTSGRTGGYLLAFGIPGFTMGDDTQSISDMACGDNVISVGAYTNKSHWPVLGSTSFVSYAADDDSPENPVGQIAEFSSYGKTFGGKQLPHIAGPGEAIVSAYSYYYQNGDHNPYGDQLLSATLAGEERAEYWSEMSGTSMSAPFVAGVIALWLQADPTLTYDKVIDILKETSVKDEFTAAAPERFGYGKIDALAGIRKILGLSAVNGVTVDSDILISEAGAGNFDVFVPGAKQIEAALYSVAGAQVASVNAQGENASLSADAAPGVYIIRVNADGKTKTQKVIIR